MSTVSCGIDPTFEDVLEQHRLAPLVRGRVRTLQVNVGKRCNQACHHCHVDAGPQRKEMMLPRVVERVVDLLEVDNDIEVVDITGGAPELNPNFRRLVVDAKRLGREVIDRCNLTVLFERGMDDVATFLAAHEVRITASLPCYRKENVDEQRGRNVFDRSIAALRALNALGYGLPGSSLRLDLVYNPVGASLPPLQETLEARYKEELGSRFGIEFHNLLTLTNMPIKRFADFLERSGQLDAYMGLLVNHFNPATIPDLMCRSLLSVGWDGRLYDCDFNQMLEMPLGAASERAAQTIWDIESFAGLTGARIATGGHCYGCTAGAGSSCGGALQ